jgi:hypothetical protein
MTQTTINQLQLHFSETWQTLNNWKVAALKQEKQEKAAKAAGQPAPPPPAPAAKRGRKTPVPKEAEDLICKCIMEQVTSGVQVGLLMLMPMITR